MSTLATVDILRQIRLVLDEAGRSAIDQAIEAVRGTGFACAKCGRQIRAAECVFLQANGPGYHAVCAGEVLSERVKVLRDALRAVRPLVEECARAVVTHDSVYGPLLRQVDAAIAAAVPPGGTR